MGASLLKNTAATGVCGLALSVATAAQAAPLISVTTDDLDVSYFVETTLDSITTVHSDSASGSVLSGGEEVAYNQAYKDSTDGENYLIDLRAAGYQSSTNSFHLDAEADDYPYSVAGSYAELDDVGDIGAEVTLTWGFSVIDEDVGFRGGVFNEEDPYPLSQAELALFDVTLGSTVMHLSGGFGITDEITLVAGHDYILTAIAGDYAHEDENTYVSFSFDRDAIITSSVPEPGALTLVMLGMVGLFFGRERP